MDFFKRYGIFAGIGFCTSHLGYGLDTWQAWFWILALNALIHIRDKAINLT